MTVPCARCGIEREVNHSREYDELCRDCRVVERDMARRGCGTDLGYREHIKTGHLACEPCLKAHREADERRRRARGVPARAQARCGTTSGYDKHRRLGEPTCPACRAANVAAVTDRKRRRDAA